MWWSPTERRRAVSGLSALWSKVEWRSSQHAPEIRRALMETLHDNDEVNRFNAARAAPFLADDHLDGIRLLGERLLVERHPEVAALLVRGLAHFRDTHPDSIDSIIDDLAAVEPWATALLVKTENGRDNPVGAVTQLVLYLALRSQTPIATSLIDNWFRNPTATDASRAALHGIRPWLELKSDRAAESARAFTLLRLAANALNEQLTADHSNRDEVREIFLGADSIISDIYFASGAHALDGEAGRAPEEGFAKGAFETLGLLTEFREPSIVHHAVETLAHLAPIDPSQAFLLVGAFVKPGDPYTYDELAADAVIALIERFLAEFREHVVENADLLTAIRSVLDAFVRAGWPRGVALSYRLGDAFR